MSELAQTDPATHSGEALAPFVQAIADLRKAGAHQLDAVGLHYLEVLSQRVVSQQGRVREKLEARLYAALDAFKSRLNQAPMALQSAGPSDAQADVQERRSPLSELTHYLGTHAQNAVLDSGEPLRTRRPELKSVRQFRNTWSKLSAEQQLTRALDQAPRNAGPINSHMLVLKSLALMHEISPDYLNRFMAYADALLCLEQPAKDVPQSKPAGDGAAPKKARTTRAKSSSGGVRAPTDRLR